MLIVVRMHGILCAPYVQLATRFSMKSMLSGMKKLRVDWIFWVFLACITDVRGAIPDASGAEVNV